MSKRKNRNPDHVKRHNTPTINNEVISQPLEALLTPAIDAQQKYYKQLGLRNRIINWSLMVAAVLTLLWRQVPSVQELTRLLAREELLWCRVTKIAQQSLAERFLVFPAELFERVFKDLLSQLQHNWQQRTQRPLPDSIKFARRSFEQVWVADGTTLEALFLKLKSLEHLKTGELSGKICTVIDLVTRLPIEIWFHTNPSASNTNFVYKHWMGIFYPAQQPSDEHLPFYAEHFPTVEVNFSFYRLPERAVFESWRSQTPENFVFAVKGSRYLTHMKKLKDQQEPLARLMERASGLQEKLGLILFQFPHTWSVNIERLQSFLALLQTYPQQRYTFEFRHPSWLIPQVYNLLERAGASLCLPVSPEVPLDICLTAPWTYIRMHRGEFGTGYTEAELSTWATRISSFLAQGVDVYVYFNNNPEGHAIRDGDCLQALLSDRIH